MKRTIINGLITGLSASLVVACGGTDSSSSSSKMLATTAACFAAWNSTIAYNGGAQVSYSSVNYTAAYWTQGNNPSTNNGPAGSGEPWISNGACGATPTPTPTPAPTPTPTPAPTPTPTPAPTPTPTPTPAPTPSCTYQTWTSGVNYPLGTIVKYPANGNFYKEVNAGTNGSDATDPTISTWYWSPTTCSTPTPAPTPTPTPAPTPTPTPAPTPTPTPAPTPTPTPAPTPSCTYQTWTSGVNYPLGTIVKYPANGNFYKEVNAGTNGSDATDPTISTWYWSPTTCSTPTPTPTSTAIVGGYYPSWVASPVRLRNIDSHYNLIYLFAATAPTGDTSGNVTWTPPSDVNGAATNWSADIQYARNTQHRKVILSVGGSGHAMSFPNRTVSTNFVNSIDVLYNQWGGFDGIDWNTFEGQTPDTSEMIWASQELKRRHPGFIVTAPPAPWNTTDQQFCVSMLNAAAIDYCAPQYYDGPNLADPAWALPNIDTWVNLIGANHLVIGFGVDPNTANYWNISSAVSTWKQIKAKYPTIHGAFDWQINNDLLQGYPFAQQLGPLVP